MGEVVAVTRGGRGSVYLFSSVEQADEHPIVQYGDAILTSASDIRRSFSRQEQSWLASRVGDQKLMVSIRDYGDSNSALVDELWSSLIRDAKGPPTDPAEICSIVSSDRRATRLLGITYRSAGVKSMVEAKGVATEGAGTTEAENDARKTRPVPREAKYAETSVIKMLADKDGKHYGHEHNPKKPGSASHQRFAHYRDGMTVKAAKDAGISLGDIDNDIKKGYISLS